MATKQSAVVLMIITTLFAAAAQVLFKKGVIDTQTDFYLGVGVIILGLITYAVASIIMIYAFRNGEVTVLYPIVTLSYLWVGLLSVHFFGELMNLYKWIGVIIIIIGISCIGVSSKKTQGVAA